jgi:LAO/AO transport system kinase
VTRSEGNGNGHGMLAERIRQGDVRAAARLITHIENSPADALPVLQALYPATGRAYVIGITGPPGAGKSSLTNALVAAFRRDRQRVGVIAVDPTSPFSGGAILADRVRMQRHALDEGVFIRSMATRGNLGGLARATLDAVAVLDALGSDVILIETVGTGQAEVDIAHAAHTTIVLAVPGLGDSMQAFKAGVMEIGDIFVVNKADRDGADQVVRELRGMLDQADPAPAWQPPILQTIAPRETGMDGLLEAIDAHRSFLSRTSGGSHPLKARARHLFRNLLQERVMAVAMARLERAGWLEAMIDRIACREIDPHSAALETVRTLGWVEGRVARGLAVEEGPA